MMVLGSVSVDDLVLLILVTRMVSASYPGLPSPSLLFPVFPLSDDPGPSKKGSQAVAPSNCPESQLCLPLKTATLYLPFPQDTQAMWGGLPGSGAYHVHLKVFKPFTPSEKKVNTPTLSDRKPRIFPSRA